MLKASPLSPLLAHCLQVQPGTGNSDISAHHLILALAATALLWRHSLATIPLRTSYSLPRHLLPPLIPVTLLLSPAPTLLQTSCINISTSMVPLLLLHLKFPSQVSILCSAPPEYLCLPILESQYLLLTTCYHQHSVLDMTNLQHESDYFLLFI